MTDPKATQAAVSPTQPLLAASAADTATTRGDPEAPGETVDLSGEVRLGYAPTLAGDGDGPAAASASASAPGESGATPSDRPAETWAEVPASSDPRGSDVRAM